MFRPAREHPPWRHALHTLLQVVAFWGCFLGLLPAAIEAGERALGWPPMACPASPWLGPLLFAGAGALGLWSAAVLVLRGGGTPLPLASARHFVVGGPYRWLRNPMALAGIVQGVAVGVWRDRASIVVYALAGAVVWHAFARPAEERDLTARFGAAFTRYRQEIPLWLPWRAPAVVERPAALLLASVGLSVAAGPTCSWPLAVAIAVVVAPLAYWLWSRPHTLPANRTSSGHNEPKSPANAS